MAFLILFSAVVFFAPEFGGWFLLPNNFVPADPLKTPDHIVQPYHGPPCSAGRFVVAKCTLSGWERDRFEPYNGGREQSESSRVRGLSYIHLSHQA